MWNVICVISDRWSWNYVERQFFLMQTLVLLPINSVKWCGKRDSPKIALNLYVINTKILVEYFNILPYDHIIHLHITTKVEATPKLIYWNMLLFDIFGPFISLVKINCPSPDFQLTKSCSYIILCIKWHQVWIHL